MHIFYKRLLLVLAFTIICDKAVSQPVTRPRSFVCQLQSIDLEAIAQTSFDWVIIDYSADGSDETAYTAAEIEAVKNSINRQKTVLAYLSIGEAEDYRFYWQASWHPGSPAWLGPENNAWTGNYTVQYWHTEWRQIVLTYLDKIIDAGFDGVYLDLVDAYITFADAGRVTAAVEMAGLVDILARHGRNYKTDFLIIPQNGAHLAEEVAWYLDVVDGIGQEDLHYGYLGDGIATPSNVTAEIESVLDAYRNQGKTVLTIDYPFSDGNIPLFDLQTQIRIDDAYSRSLTKGYIPYCTVRDLDQLIINPGHEPTGIINFNHLDNSEGVGLAGHPNPSNFSLTVESPPGLISH